MTLFALTMGDYAGIGPEIILKYFLARHRYSGRIVVVGEKKVFDFYSSILKLPVEINDAGEGPFNLKSNCLNLLSLERMTGKITPGRGGANEGRAAMRAVAKAVDLWKKGLVAGVITAPINKKNIQAGGYSFPGHTEYLAETSGIKRFAMMLTDGKLSVVPVTIHIAVKDIYKKLSKRLVYGTIMTVAGHFKKYGSGKPSLAVTGLNPHCGEEGAFGDEEKRIIIPAVEKARAEGVDIAGPFPADSLFGGAVRYDAVIVMYHDQGLIPIKMRSFGRAVNVTLGLPFIRTSVDHGTAYDIAGRGVADCGSLDKAVSLAFRYSLAERSR